MANKIKIAVLFLGDVLALYVGLFATLILRYGPSFFLQFHEKHFLPFTIIFIIWVTIFYIAGLYDLKRLHNNLDFIRLLNLTLSINFILAVFFFYLIPAFGIAPKTNLFIFIVLFFFIEIFWRRVFNVMTISSDAPNRVIIVGTSETADTVCETIKSNPQLGYEIAARITEDSSQPHILSKFTLMNNVNLLIIPRHFKNNPELTNVLYELLGSGVEIRDLTSFYELIIGKVPLADLEETWFLENLINQQKFYDKLKRALELLSAILIQVVALPLELIISLIIKITSRGPIIYRQVRVGKNGREFILYKFRTMPLDAEKDGAKWAGENDPRATPFGRLLRRTHLDELPQLINIMKGELSFVGPRPERPEFVKILKDKIPYYEIRLLVKPGVTGWAQINYHKDTELEDVKEKLQYDIYYLKNRSIILDLSIFLKTIKSFFVNQ